MDHGPHFEVEPDHRDEPGDDVREQEVAERLTQLFVDHPTTVFYGRQLEVRFEDDYFHWITNRALRSLEGVVTLERHPLQHSSPTTLAWNRRYRYPRRQIAEVIALINAYANPDVSYAVGDRGEELVLDGFAARNRFTCLGRNVNALDGVTWMESGHDLDFVFERDGRRYGVEVKNTLRVPRQG
jgi:hypothetical protein